MKKLILSILIFCSVLLPAQIQIPQVVGLPAALSGKEAKLPSTPSNPESRFLNGNKQWAEIVLGSGGYASNVYFTNLTSTIVGTYKQTSGTHELTETIASGTCNNNEVLIHTYLFEQPVGITTVDAGVWRITLNSVIDASAGDSKFKFVQYKRSAAGVETDMFTVYSNTIENRVGYEGYLNNVFETVQPSFTVESTDRLGCRVYATTTAAGSRTLSYKVGDGFASYLNTPLALRHDQNRDKNGNPNFQHLTSAQVAKVDATSGTNTGDETLTSIKTKLGAATPVSDGYLRYQDFADFSDRVSNATHTGDATGSAALTLATVNSNVGTFNNITINAKGLATAGSNVSYEPSFSKNTAFNKNFGTTTGTVLEGRTFGTAANSAVGNFIQNQNASAQSANMWINGLSSSGRVYGSTLGRFGEGYRSVELRQLDSDFGSAMYLYADAGTDQRVYRIANKYSGSGTDLVIDYSDARAYNTEAVAHTYTERFRLSKTGAATFSSTVNSTGFLLNGNNLTSSLSTNYIPKWNGSAFVNATAGTDYQLPITLTTNGTSGAATLENGVMNVPNYTSNATSGSYSPTITLLSGLASKSTPLALYTNIGSVKHAALSGTVTTNTTGTCSFRFTLPSSILGNNSIFHVYVFGYTGSYVADAYVTNYGSDSNVDLYFNSTSPSGSSFRYSIMVDYD